MKDGERVLIGFLLGPEVRDARDIGLVPFVLGLAHRACDGRLPWVDTLLPDEATCTDEWRHGIAGGPLQRLSERGCEYVLVDQQAELGR